ARAIARLEKNPLPTRVAPPVDEMFDRLAASMQPPLRFVMANRWLFGPLVEHRLAQKPVTAALLRTTTAPTLFNAGVKENVLPAEAVATVNFRIVPGQGSADVEQHVRRTIDDPEIDIERLAF